MEEVGSPLVWGFGVCEAGSACLAAGIGVVATFSVWGGEGGRGRGRGRGRGLAFGCVNSSLVWTDAAAALSAGGVNANSGGILLLPIVYKCS